MRTISSARLFGVVAVLSQASTAWAEPACEAHELGSLGGTDTHANDINDWGQIVGRSATSGGVAEHAFLWERSRMRDLGGLAEDAWSAAAAINEWGTIVGYAEDARGGNTVPVVWTRRGLARLPFEGAWGVAVDINNRGQIVGNTGFSECLLWESAGSEPTRLEGLGGSFCQAAAINDAGVIVGTATTAEGDTRAFVWRNGVMIEAESIDDPANEYSFSDLLDINNRGLAVGRLVTSSLYIRPFVWTRRQGGRPLEVTDAVAAAVNDWGAIALVQRYDAASLLLSNKDGDTVTLGELGGGVSYDDLAINNRFQAAWTTVAGEPLSFHAYVCQLPWPASLGRAPH